MSHNNHRIAPASNSGASTMPFIVVACARCGHVILCGAQCRRCCPPQPVRRIRRKVSKRHD